MGNRLLDKGTITLPSRASKDLEKEADTLLRRLFPICRSITGDGVRQTLDILKGIVDLEIKEVPSGTACYDWVVPDEWNIRDAYIEDGSGRKVVDFRKSNLHVVNYSVPVDRTMSFEELEPFLHTLPDLPNAIPYRTTYYERTWGFCLTHEQKERMDRKATYHVHIGSTLSPGSLTYGEALIQGSSDQEYLISTYCCHPSLANDNLSGVVLWALLLRELQSGRPRHSYRFVIVPETIGAIAYLAQNEKAMTKVTGGLIPTTVAGPGPFGYKHTFLGDHLIDRAVHRTFAERGTDYIPYPFHVNGSDESHYSAPFFRIPVGTICKDKYYEYDYYHTSLDDLNFISPRNLVKTFELYCSVIEKLELNTTYTSRNPHCEAMLSKRGLYPKLGGSVQQGAADLNKDHLEREYDGGITGRDIDAISWVMFHSDGQTSLLDIAERTGIPLKQLHKVAEILKDHGLLAEGERNL